jgi:dTDP-4-dehydrorhamnose 3,5-epimerase
VKTHVTETPLEGLVIVTIDYFEDERGFFIESWHKRDFAAAGLDLEFVQEGHSRSAHNVLRGIHYQDMTAPMGKLVRCTLGCVLDVAVDLRVGSPTFGCWYAIEISAQNKQMVYVPVGFGHGFATLSDAAEIQYKQTGYYTPSAEGNIAWNDPDIGIRWPLQQPILSKRDQHGMSLSEYLKKPAFKYADGKCVAP